MAEEWRVGPRAPEESGSAGEPENPLITIEVTQTISLVLEGLDLLGYDRSGMYCVDDKDDRAKMEREGGIWIVTPGQGLCGPNGEAYKIYVSNERAGEIVKLLTFLEAFEDYVLEIDDKLSDSIKFYHEALAQVGKVLDKYWIHENGGMRNE